MKLSNCKKNTNWTNFIKAKLQCLASNTWILVSLFTGVPEKFKTKDSFMREKARVRFRGYLYHVSTTILMQNISTEGSWGAPTPRTTILLIWCSFIFGKRTLHKGTVVDPLLILFLVTELVVSRNHCSPWSLLPDSWWPSLETVQTCSLEDLRRPPPPPPPTTRYWHLISTSGSHRNTYGWQAGGAHPTGILCFFRQKISSPKRRRAGRPRSPCSLH